MAADVYAWLKDNGCWLARGQGTPTHLLLDGGRACVSEELHGAFLNAYAACVVRAARGACARPSIAELRTPVFKLFMDLDARYAEEPSDPLAVASHVLATITDLVSRVFREEEAVVCVSTRAKRDKEAWKRGFHVIWPGVRVTAETALLFRGRVLEALKAGPNPFLNEWASVVDACVYKSNGLRMPWSAKGKGDDSAYVPAAILAADGTLTPVDAPSSVPDVRAYLRKLSVRTFGSDESPCSLLCSGGPSQSPSKAPVFATSLAEYAGALAAVDAALPLQFAGQRFTGVVKGDGCFMLRSTSRWCGNLGREHRTNNVYFVLTRRGVHQRCYCRCETTDGRKYGWCKDYCSETWPVPSTAIADFFGEDGEDSSVAVAHVAPHVHRMMPSQLARQALDLTSLLEQRLHTSKRKRRAK